MAIVNIEKLGGVAGFGGVFGHLRSRGQLDTEKLSVSDQQAVQLLFTSAGEDKSSHAADGFRFRLSRTTAAGVETVEVPEEAVPSAVASCVKDELV